MNSKFPISNFKSLDLFELNKIKGGVGLPTVCTTPAPGGTGAPVPYPNTSTGTTTTGATSTSSSGGVTSSNVNGSSTMLSGCVVVIVEGKR